MRAHLDRRHNYQRIQISSIVLLSSFIFILYNGGPPRTTINIPIMQLSILQGVLRYQIQQKAL